MSFKLFYEIFSLINDGEKRQQRKVRKFLTFAVKAIGQKNRVVTSRGITGSRFFFFFFFKDMSEQAQGGAEEERGTLADSSLSSEPDSGLNLRTPRS